MAKCAEPQFSDSKLAFLGSAVRVSLTASKFSFQGKKQLNQKKREAEDGGTSKHLEQDASKFLYPLHLSFHPQPQSGGAPLPCSPAIGGQGFSFLAPGEECSQSQCTLSSIELWTSLLVPDKLGQFGELW